MHKDPIAIVGMGCRFPGSADSLEKFWNNLVNGIDSITEIPEDRWDTDSFYGGEKIHPTRSRSKWGGFIDGIKEFDARFFGLSSKEACCMDPQQRLLLETAWHAIEDAGLQLTGRDSIGVYVGAGNYEFAVWQHTKIEPPKANPYSATGSALSIMANRVSHFFDLTGPSMTVDTACSASLHAIHLACHAIWNNECQMSLAGGVNFLIYPSTFVSFSNFGGLSADGRCKAFDASADGFVKAEGAGMVFLKPLKKAVQDQDRIYACIHNSRVNQDGHTPVITAPSPASQLSLISRTITEAGITPDLVQYVEAHGTGTAIGDPIEAHAIGKAIGIHKTGETPCLIGSVKTNIGHLETASGIAGLIKNALICHHGMIPGNLHFTTPNPDIEFDRYHLKIATGNQALPAHSEPGHCYLGLNSFGFGGANAFILMAPHVAEDAHRFKYDRPETDFRYMLPVSARSQQAFKSELRRFHELLDDAAENSDIQHICAFAAHRRAHHKQFSTIVSGKETAELKRRIMDQLSISTKMNKPVSDKVVFVFSGQGPQWYAMGRQLYKAEKVFRDTIHEAHEALQAIGGWSLLDEFLASEESTRISLTSYAQPMITALQLGLDRLWRSRGVAPSAIVGHSIGEVAAGVSAGCFDLPQGMKIIYHRARTMDRASSKGAMLAAGISRETAFAIAEPFGGTVSVAAVNGPASVTFAGQREMLKKIEATLNEQEKFNRFLNVDYAFHSAFMAPVREDLLASLDGIECNAPHTPLWSTVTGEPVTQAIHNAGYWWKNVRQTVLFGPAIEKIIDSHTLFLELSAHPVLAASIQQCLKKKRAAGRCIQSLNRNAPDTVSMDTGINDLVKAGYAVDWKRIYNVESIPHIAFPPYPWEKKEYWEESTITYQNRLAKMDGILLGRRFDFFDMPTWTNQLDLRIQTFLADHKVKQHIFFPAAGYIDIFCMAASLCVGQSFELENFSILSSIVLNASDVKNTRCLFDAGTNQLILKVSGDGATRNWDICATCKAFKVNEPETAVLDIEVFKESGILNDDKELFYRRAGEKGLNYGPCFQTLEKYWALNGSILGYVALPDQNAALFDNTYISPTVLDGVFQLIAIVMKNQGPGRRLYLPVGFDGLSLRRTAGESLYALITIVEHTVEQIIADISLYNARGGKTGHIRHFTCKAVETKENDPALWRKEVLYQYWLPKPLDWKKAPAAIGDLGDKALNNIEKAADFEKERNIRNRTLLRQSYSDNQNRLMFRFFIDAIHGIIEGYETGSRIDPDVLVKHSRAKATFTRYIKKLLSHMAADGYAEKINDREYCLTEKADDIESVDACMGICIKENPSTIYDINLIHERGANLIPMFQGTYDPLEMIMGKDRADYMRYFYTHSPMFHGNNQVVMSIIREMVARIPGKTPFRVLEIGSGMGGMTAHILPLLKHRPCEYYYTDISPAFIKQGEKQFREFDFIRFQPLDIEQAPEFQNFEPATFDLITGLDVIHAVRDIDIALGNVAALLKPGGKFILSDYTSTFPIGDFLFGPIDGWWRFDDRYRKDSPLMDQEHWNQALSNNDFINIKTVSDCDGKYHTTFIAEKQPLKNNRKAFERPAHPPVRHSEPLSWIYIGDTDMPESAYCNRRYPIHTHVENIDLKGISHVVYGGALNAVHIPIDEAEQRSIADLFFTGIIRLVSSPDFEEHAPRLVILTSGALYTSSDQKIIHPVQSAMEGMVQTLYNEKPDLRIKLIDLDPDLPLSEQIPLLIEEIATEDDREDIVAFRKQNRFVKRCDSIARPRTEFRYDGKNDSRNSHVIGLSVESPGTLDGLCIETSPRPLPGSGEVEIQVEAAGINFRDLLKILGVYPTEASDSRLLGDECAGVVTAVGESVTSFAKGDRVAFIGLGCFKTHVTVPAARLVKLPDAMSFDLAAAALTNYMTVYYALVVKADIKKGDRILIHSAAGGIGLAAIQLAKEKGAEIFATAGTGFKQDLLRSFGVTHVYSSRTLDFADRIYQDTHGEGIDIVLNSLAGPFIEKSMTLLRNYGRFLELGKRDIYDKTHISLYPFRKNISYFAIDMAEMFSPDSRMGDTVIEALQTLFEKNGVKNHCYSLFPMANFKEAFSHMSKALHFGKVVLKPSWGELTCPVQFQPEKASIKPDRSYLITGGVRGLGLLIARWLVEKGAKHLILVNRSGEPHPETAAAIQRLQEKACIEINKTNVGDRNQVAALIRKIKENHPPLDGVFHCAVVLKDKAIGDMTHDDVYDVLAPKAFGGLHLHEETKHLDLSIFFLMGSMASMVGNIGQSNYSAANTVLKSIAAFRIKSGLAAQYVDWGLFHETGVVFRDKDLLRKVRKFGLGGLSNDDFIEYLERILGSRALLWGVPGSGFEKYLKEGVDIAPRMSILKNRTKSKKATGTDEFSADFLSTPRENRLGKMMLLIKHTISDLLDLSVEDIEDEDKLTDLGIDSLNGIELITRLENDLGASVSPASLVQAPSIRLISERLLTILNLDYDILKENPDTRLNRASWKSGRETDPDLATALDQIKSLPDISGTVRQKRINSAPENRTIFLTGVTGLLGSRLFKDLITQTPFHIYLLIRPDIHETDGAARLQETVDKFNLDIDLEKISSRFTIFEGDITRPDLGLDGNDYHRIQTTIDAVLHSAAKVHHLKPYSMLKKANVDGTLEVLKLCITPEDVIPLHYVSSIGICFSDMTLTGPYTENDIPETFSGLRNGYLKSKWISEWVLRRMQAEGVPCNIYRPGLIFSEDSMITLAGDFIWRMFQTSLLIGKYPDSEINLLLAPVKAVSMAMVRSIAENHSNKTLHLFETQTRFRDLSLEAVELGYDLDPVDASHWHFLSMDLFTKAPLTHPLADYLNANDIKVIETMTTLGESSFEISCEQTMEIISSLQLPQIQIDREVLKACILALQEAEIISRPKQSA